MFLVLQEKSYYFPGNVDKDVSSNHKKEVETMITAVPKLSDAVTNYASHFLRENLQFSAIEKNMQTMKTDQSIVYMIPYHKQNVLHMRYWEGQVDFCG